MYHRDVYYVAKRDKDGFRYSDASTIAHCPALSVCFSILNPKPWAGEMVDLERMDMVWGLDLRPWKYSG